MRLARYAPHSFNALNAAPPLGGRAVLNDVKPTARLADRPRPAQRSLHRASRPWRAVRATQPFMEIPMVRVCFGLPALLIALTVPFAPAANWPVLAAMSLGLFLISRSR